MLDEGQHAACVDAWLARSAKGSSPEALVRLFEAALGTLWARADTTLGNLTLTAIAERVLWNASEKFTHFSALRVDPTSGVQFRELCERIGSIPGSELFDGIRFVLVEFLTVIGNLTAEILTPELHSELSKVAHPPGAGIKNEKS